MLTLCFFFALPGRCAKSGSEDAAQTDLADGTYTIELEMEGGSGKSTITSPAALTVQDGKAYVRIEWSSPNYDYMIVNDTKYLPLEGRENSTFEIPVPAFDQPVTVIGDTTAMSTPHEVEYTLTFFSDTVSGGQTDKYLVIVAVLAAAVLAAGGFTYLKMRKRNR